MPTRLLRRRSLQHWRNTRGQRPPDDGMRCFGLVPLTGEFEYLQCVQQLEPRFSLGAKPFLKRFRKKEIDCVQKMFLKFVCKLH